MTGDATASRSYGHICWAYDDPAALDSRAVPFLAAGLAAGEQVWFVAPGTSEGLTRRLDRLPGLDDGLRRGAIRIVSIEQTYRADEPFDPETQVRAYQAATDAALAAGYTGLRLMAEATSLIRTPAQREVFARYEHLIDRYMHRRPMSAICAYDRRELGDAAIAEVACMHPETNTDVLFQLHACGPAEGDVALAGELDPSNHRLFAAALERAELRPVDGRLVVEAAQLRFIDHRCLMQLRDHARRLGATAVLRTSRPAAGRLVDLLELADIRVEATR